MIKQVGYKYPPRDKKDDNPFCYKEVLLDEDGWADVDQFLPLPFDLVSIKTDHKIINGWHTGFVWDALRLLPQYKILKWKKKSDECE